MPSSPLRVLRNRNYRLYFSGQLVSMSGAWMQSVAQSWLVYRLSHSGYWLGVITFCSQLPAFLASPLAGVVADRADRRRILMAVQLVSMLQSLVLAALILSGQVTLSHVVALSIVLGVANAFDSTTRHAFAVDMVGKEELSSAIALNSVMLNGARILGPALAGVLLSAFGESWCFLLAGLSSLPVYFGLKRMQVARHPPPSSTGGVIANIAEAMRYARRTPLIFRILLLSAAVCFISCPYIVLMPIFAKKVLEGDAHTLAALTGMLGLGAMVGAIFFNRAAEAAIIKRHLIQDVICWGIGLIVLGLSRHTWLSLCAMFFIGYFMMNLFPTMNNGIQQTVEDSMRGRVMSLYTMTFLGTVPIGSLLIGALSDHVGAPAVTTASGVVTVGMGLALVLRNQVRARRRRRAESADDGLAGVAVS